MKIFHKNKFFLCASPSGSKQNSMVPQLMASTSPSRSVQWRQTSADMAAFAIEGLILQHFNF
jgi:hypothetical protein